MIRAERLAKITEYVQTKRYASIDELVNAMDVSKATIRRDLNTLSSEEKVLLTRGGATWNSDEKTGELAYNEKRLTNASDKMILGEQASKLIKDNMAVIVSAGTTTRALTPYLNTFNGVNIVTNDIAIASDLVSYDGISVTLTGGQLRKNFYTVRGYAAEELISKMKTDIAFIGLESLDVTSGGYISNMDEVVLIECIIKASEKLVVMCDQSKFENNAFIQVCELSDIDFVITNKEINKKYIKALEDMGITVLLA